MLGDTELSVIGALYHFALLRTKRRVRLSVLGDTEVRVTGALYRLTLVFLTPCMYTHGFTLVYIYIYVTVRYEVFIRLS